ncbi:MAG: hypothetical protein ACERLG_01775 [Sedimentibacter sp.]
MMNYRGFSGIRNFHDFGMGHGYVHGGIIPMIIMAVLVVIIAVVIFKKFNKKHIKNASIEELNMRFAKGEVTEEDYKRMKNVLKY